MVGSSPFFILVTFKGILQGLVYPEALGEGVGDSCFRTEKPQIIKEMTQKPNKQTKKNVDSIELKCFNSTLFRVSYPIIIDLNVHAMTLELRPFNPFSAFL